MAAQKQLFPELGKTKKGRNDKKRDPWGRYDTRDRFEAYERKIERLRQTIKYLIGISSAFADAIRKRDMEIDELKRKLISKN